LKVNLGKVVLFGLRFLFRGRELKIL
jgi:hypothetical protein